MYDFVISPRVGPGCQCCACIRVILITMPIFAWPASSRDHVSPRHPASNVALSFPRPRVAATPWSLRGMAKSLDTVEHKCGQVEQSPSHRSSQYLRRPGSKYNGPTNLHQIPLVGQRHITVKMYESSSRSGPLLNYSENF